MSSVTAGLRWQSDWNGDEVGHDDIPIVGLYSLPQYGISMYIDIMNDKIVEVWLDEEE